MPSNVKNLENKEIFISSDGNLRIAANGYQPQKNKNIKVSHTPNDIKGKTPPKKP
ncbi:hypothetical protein ACG9YY_11765 [Acinetobacter pittii]|uniref:hypothetical protein n=1 Tax=Acinetobacter pittii TaxID=48296 RepID=UPI003AF90B93